MSLDAPVLICMRETLLQGNDWLTWIENTEPDTHAAALTSAPAQPTEANPEPWEKTDRLLRFPSRPNASKSVWDGAAPRTLSTSPRAQWLQDHNVETYFLDAGIGCCWFAQYADDEPVCGETEQAALDRLARDYGFEPFAVELVASR